MSSYARNAVAAKRSRADESLAMLPWLSLSVFCFSNVSSPTSLLRAVSSPVRVRQTECAPPRLHIPASHRSLVATIFLTLLIPTAERISHVPRPCSTHPPAARPVHKLLLTGRLPPVIHVGRQLGHCSSHRSARPRHRLVAAGEHRLQPSPPAVRIHLCQLRRLVRFSWRPAIRRQHIGQLQQGRQGRQPFQEWIAVQRIARPGPSKKGQWERGSEGSSAGE